MEDWFTVASPDTTVPSSGIMFPVRTTMQSPTFTSPMGTSVSLSPTRSHTRSIFSDMAPARSATDFLCVHSSRISPRFSMNITELAVEKSRRRSDTPIAVASSTETESLPCRSEESPSFRYFTERITARAVRTGVGRNSLKSARRRTADTSLSSNSRFSSREVCSGVSPIASAEEKAKEEKAAITAVRSSQ